MIVLAVTALALVSILFIFIISPVRTKLIYRRNGQDDYMAIELLFFWGRLPIRLELTSFNRPRRIFRPLVKIRSKVTSKTKRPVVSARESISVSRLYRSTGRFRYYLELFYPVLKYMGRKTRLIQFRWETKMGFLNAAYTGIFTGALWTLKGTLSSILYRVTGNCENHPELTIVPVYNQEVFNTELDCIFEAYPGHIIISGLKLIKFWLISRMSRGSEHYARPTPN